MTTFLTSDTHFGHEKTVTTFKRKDGSPLRSFANVEEMDETMIQRWNERIGPKDKVYHLGDVVINRRFLKTLERLNGDKVLIKGNHDIFDLSEYIKYFRDIRGYHVLNGLILSHIPMHVESLGRFGTNVHGHLHANRVMRVNQYHKEEIDPRYHNICVELTDYAPISLDELYVKIKDEGGDIGFRKGEGAMAVM